MTAHSDTARAAVPRSALATLSTALVADCLDQLGLPSAVMEHHIRPIAPQFRAAGFAATVRVVEVDAPPDQPDAYYERELAAVDGLRAGDLLVVSHARHAGFWGELLAIAAARRGCVGLVGDCLARDSGVLVDMGFPSFVAGLDPRDSLSRLDVDQLGGEIECGGVRVCKGDLVVADNDGIVVVPADAASQVVQAALVKAERENAMRLDLQAGMGIVPAFRKHNVL